MSSASSAPPHEALRDDWAGARTAATQAAEAGDGEAARQIVEAFHARAANIAQLVLWIGYLQWHFRVNDEGRLRRRCSATSRPSRTVTLHPTTGKEVPDETVRTEMYQAVKTPSVRVATGLSLLHS
jgi:hypothetical protein